MKGIISKVLKGSGPKVDSSQDAGEKRALMDRQIEERKAANAVNLERLKEQVPVINTRYIETMERMANILKGA